MFRDDCMGEHMGVLWYESVELLYGALVSW